jgi:hypothetical protein
MNDAQSPAPAPAPSYTEGHCAEKRKPGGCQLHNLHCGYPACDRKAVASPAVQAWQPIETAPKTGRKLILSYVNRCGKARTVLARWLTDEEAAETDSDGVGLEGGWYECIDNWEDYTEVAIHQGEPTHWMPPPAAPDSTVPDQLTDGRLAKLRKFLDSAAGEGFELDGVDAGELYLELFPDAFAEAKPPVQDKP